MASEASISLLIPIGDSFIIVTTDIIPSPSRNLFVLIFVTKPYYFLLVESSAAFA